MRYREQREKERKSGRKEEEERRVSSPSDPILTPSISFGAHFSLRRFLYLNAGTG